MTAPKSLRDRIIDYLWRIAPDEANAKTIAVALRLNNDSLRKALSRLMGEKDCPVVLAHRGFYRHKMDLDLVARLDKMKRIELHGIKLEGTCLEKNTGYFLSGTAKHKYRRRGTYKEIFEDRVVTITVHEGGLTEVWLSTSDKPMTFNQFDRFTTWMKAKMDFIDEYSWKVKQIGLNVDQRMINLDGVTSVRLQAFRNAWFQVYQKGEDCVRWEVHMFPDLKLEEAIVILRSLVSINPLGGAYQPPAEDKDDHSYG